MQERDSLRAWLCNKNKKKSYVIFHSTAPCGTPTDRINKIVFPRHRQGSIFSSSTLARQKVLSLPSPNAPEVNTWRPPHFACNLSFTMWKSRLNVRELMRGFLGLTVNKNKLISAEEHYPGNAMKFYWFGIKRPSKGNENGNKWKFPSRNNYETTPWCK